MLLPSERRPFSFTHALSQLFATGLAGCLTVFLAGANNADAQTSGRALSLTMGTVVVKDSVEGAASEKFAELVDKKTKGAIRVTIYHGSQLGNQPTLVQGITTGSIDLMPVWMTFLDRWNKDYKMMNFLYMFRDREHLDKFIASPTFQKMVDTFPRQGIRLLASNWREHYKVIISRDPIRSISDLKGKKVRVPEIEMISRAWKALGAVPVTTAWSESYLALRQGVVDAVDVPMSLVVVSKLWEVGKYVTVTDHQQQNQGVLINEGRYASLTPEQKTALTEAANEAGDFYTALVKERVQADVEKLKKEGVEIISLDTAPFRTALASAARDVEAEGGWTRGFYDEIQSIK
jgi:tripartite ATP-independent transporter DctP family solute receptor